MDLGWLAVRNRLSGPSLTVVAGGELSERWYVSGPAGRGEGLRRSHDDAAGVKPDTSPVDRTTVNVGTIRIALPMSGDRCVASRRVRVGRSRRSTPRPGKPVTWGRAAVRESRRR